MFWDDTNGALKTLRVHDAAQGREYRYDDLAPHAERLRAAAAGQNKRLAIVFCDNSVESIIAYLGLLRSGHAILLADLTLDPSLKARLISIYRPEIAVVAGGTGDDMEGYGRPEALMPKLSFYRAKDECGEPIFPGTGILLSTSGTTGSPKLVRLTHANIQANAESIATYLGITSDETAITSLPFSYSYGLSVINTHILHGAKIVCTNASIVQAPFWDVFRAQQCTSFAGVPFHYQILERLRFERMKLPSLRTMTQAGGHLATEKVRTFQKIASGKGYRFFVMYGQTEATARMSYVPFDRLAEKLGSVGIAVPGGSIRIMRDDREVTAAGENGEVAYSGPNVMLGYAEQRVDLARGDELKGTLRTGDLGYKDADGFLYIRGRLKRFLKIFGQRLNLDDVERMLESSLGKPVACIGSDDALVVLVESGDEAQGEMARKRILDLYGIHPSAVTVRYVGALPVTPAGKKDYAAMKSMA